MYIFRRCLSIVSQSRGTSQPLVNVQILPSTLTNIHKLVRRKEEKRKRRKEGRKEKQFT